MSLAFSHSYDAKINSVITDDRTRFTISLSQFALSFSLITVLIKLSNAS